MPTTYRKTTEVDEYVEAAMSRFHPKLKEAGVTVEVLFAHSEVSPALKHHGMPALAVIKPMSQKDRAAGSADVRLLVDADRWDELDEWQRVALIDHELMHCEVQHDEEGRVKTDDSHRPKLKTRPHDHEIGIFEDVVRRHKEHALDSKAFSDLQRVMTQMEFPWGLT